MPRALPPERIDALPPLTLRASVAPVAENESRSVDVIFTTGAEIERVDWMGNRWLESLDVSERAIRLGRLNDGAPLLDSHTGRSVADQLGAVERGSARIVDGRGIARVRFSKKPAAEQVLADVRDGIVSNVSVGYRVHTYERTPANEATHTPERRRAVDWEPFEISAVPMGSDAGAHFRDARAETREPCLIVTKGEPMAVVTDRAAVVEPLADGTAPEGYELRADGRCYRAEPAAEPSDRERGILAERERIEGIINGATAVKRRRDDPEVLRMIRDGVTLVDAQRWFLDTLRREGLDDAGPRVGPSAAVTRDPLDHVMAGIRGAFLHRINPEHFKLDDQSKLYRTYSVVRCAEEVLEQRGIRTRHMSKNEIIGIALGLDTRAGLHSTSDFPLILADVANKSLRAIYEAAPQTWLPISTRITIPDFKPIRRLELGDGPALKKVLEHGEFTRGTIAEGKEQFALLTYGRIFGITRQALVNDDLDAFGRVPQLFARSARNLESDLVWAEILANRVMADGLTLFEAATHKNLVTPGTLITIGSLGTARAMMTRQKGMDGATFLNLRARYLIVPPGGETLAQQMTTSITPATNSAANPFVGLSVISEPRLEGGITLPDGALVAGDALAWYLAADPSQIPIIEYGYLDGQEGPTLDQRLGFDIDGLEIKCRLDFAAKVMNYRGLVKNAGAAWPTSFDVLGRGLDAQGRVIGAGEHEPARKHDDEPEPKGGRR
jgi:hypothetical protein